jgi:N-methylhydantoinase B
MTGADGLLIQGGGAIRHHFYTICNAVQATIARYEGIIATGDMFFVNDPHNGGGLHPQDVIILKPVFVGEALAAWIGCSAHMGDMGGMVHGSWSPNATECYQEAIRFPPVRIMEAGVERREIWDILRNNVRIPDIVEMDMRALIAGANVAAADLAQTIRQIGLDTFLKGVRELCQRVENEVRRRIGTLTDGVYRAQTWVEWREETFVIPCSLTITGDRMTFDFEGASPQTPHFFNSHRYIVISELATEISSFIAHDLPYNGGLIAALEVRCPSNSILDSRPPAPVAAGHLEVGITAVEIALQTYMLALAVSPASPLRRFLTAVPVYSGYLFQTWVGQNADETPVGWLTIEGVANGAAGAPERDGNDLGVISVGSRHSLECPDVEVMEAWYPILYDYKRPFIDELGSGSRRAGGSLEAAYRITGHVPISGVNIGNRQRVPFPGMAGGFPGMNSRSEIIKADGSTEHLDNHDQGFVLAAGDVLKICPGSGGGWGDPLDRHVDLVERDVADGRINEETARTLYGVVVGDARASEVLRELMLFNRLERASTALTPLGATGAVPHTNDYRGPLYFGIEQYGDLAVSARTGAVLARAPDHWTDGCPLLDTIVAAKSEIVIRAYLDPLDGRALAVDVVVEGTSRSFESRPKRWIESAAEKERSALSNIGEQAQIKAAGSSAIAAQPSLKISAMGR